MLQVQLPDGSVKEFSRSVTPLEVASEIGPRLAKAALAAEVDGQVVGLDFKLPTEGQVSLKRRKQKPWGRRVGILPRKPHHPRDAKRPDGHDPLD